MPKRSERGRVGPARPDDAARRAVADDLATTILVEASAGTGKTSSLVDRLVALVATGRTTIDRLTAVTFTIKAAGQLRQRFQRALETALERETEALRRERLGAALAGLDSCFLGTIHAFAARLLRERPVEAGIDPGFVEMDEPEDGVARGEAWERFASGLFLRDDPRLARFLELGISLDDLRGAFDTFCENEDVEPVIGAEGALPDFSEARKHVEAFLERAASALPDTPPAGGWRGFAEAVRSSRRLTALLDPASAPDFVRILRVLRRRNASDRAGAFRQPFEDLRENVVKPALARWAEFVHPLVIRALAEARDDYRNWRRSSGRLNFQDLLLLARDLLRDHSGVRRALFARFAPILVDEFQDTDPIQAEILFLLTGSDTAERDWKKLTPIPGSLFVVGDPKQSIYRFRRADIETYEAVRSRIARSGRVLELTTNFRSSETLCRWMNRTFSAFFPAEATREQAADVPLSPDKTGGPEVPAVFRLASPGKGSAARPVVEHDSRRIADFIAAAVASGEYGAGDFLVLFRRRAYMNEYARALEARGVSYEIASGGAFRGSRDLEALMPLLQSVADPDNPVCLVAALRGPFFGVDDEALYGFVRAGGRFHFEREIPPASDPRIARAFGLLREGVELAETLPPGAAISRFAGRLGATASAAAEELGDSRAGNLLKAFAAARTLSGEGLDFPAVVRELDRMRQQELIEQMSVEPGRRSAVRLMTLHGAKGLEARVVFLAEPAGDPSRPRDFWIDRSVDPPLGHFRVVKKTGEWSDEEIARPAGWEAMEEAEERFDAAERVRLLYVGATRAEETLIVSVKKGASGKPAGPWAPLDPRISADLPATVQAAEAPGPPPRPQISAELDDFRRAWERRSEISARPGYGAVSVTALVHAQTGPAPPREETGRGMEWGRIVHRLLEAAMQDPAVDVASYARNLLAESDRPQQEVDDLVRLVEATRGSPLWKRACEARRRLIEVPFALVVPSAELGAGEGPAETLLSGAIDLAFEEPEGWVLVDYKSDRIAGNLAALSEWYAPQIRHYRRYWERLTGKPTRAGLYFVETGEEYWLRE
jgi:ATP-dependent helicase/nuclease subunit A